MPEFTASGLVRHGFGFYNPNHAAALICALAPFCWGWCGKWRLAGYGAFAALCAALALTYSRAGVAVLAAEMVAWGVIKRRNGGLRASRLAIALAVAAFVIVAWWMRSRIIVDGAVLNRPKIWLAGLRLLAANPLGVGFEHSGKLVSAFMLPDGMTVRTLVNSHLTLLAESGVFVGGAWMAFIALALVVGSRHRRTWLSFAGLVLSASLSSVFDWHVLFDLADKGGLSVANFALSWTTLLLFVAEGVGMVIWTSLKKRTCKTVVLPACLSAALCAIALVISTFIFRVPGTPRAESGFAIVGEGVARVYRDAKWSLRDVRMFFPRGARFYIPEGVPAEAKDCGEIWLFGNSAESVGRFRSAGVTFVSPPEFCEAPGNVVRILQRRFGEEMRDDSRVEAY